MQLNFLELRLYDFWWFMEDECQVRTSTDVKKEIQISESVTIVVKSFEEPKVI